MLAKVTYNHKACDKRHIYVQGSPAMIGVRIGELLLMPHPQHGEAYPVMNVSVERLPDPEQV